MDIGDLAQKMSKMGLRRAQTEKEQRFLDIAKTVAEHHGMPVGCIENFCMLSIRIITMCM